MLTKTLVPSFCDLIRSHQFVRCVIVDSCRLDLDDIIAVLYACTCQNTHSVTMLTLSNCMNEKGENCTGDDR